jgi:hypothetical protein
MTAHLIELFDWIIRILPDSRFEIRCLHPSDEARKVVDRMQFAVTRIDEAVTWAAEKNTEGFNVYVIPNVVRPRAPDRYAKDEDMFVGVHNFVDADGIDDPSTLYLGHYHKFSFIVVSGTIPKLRLHGYFRLRDFQSGLDSVWRATQVGLAEKLGTDITVCNASRAARLAGSVSYPPPHKVERGYVTEVTAIHLDRQEVDDTAFIAHFKPAGNVHQEMPAYVSDETAGNVPMFVVDACLGAIPPIAGCGQHNIQLDIVMAAKDANPSAASPSYSAHSRDSLADVA